MLFRYGEMIRKVPEQELLSELKKEIDEIVRVYEETGEIPGRETASAMPNSTKTIMRQIYRPYREKSMKGFFYCSLL